jgi:hypothetical protein
VGATDGSYTTASAYLVIVRNPDDEGAAIGDLIGNVCELMGTTDFIGKLLNEER